MRIKLGVHTGPQDLQMGELKRVWARADEAGAAAGRQRLGALTGIPSEVIDRIGAYIEAGADGLHLAFRPPVDWEAYEAYIEQVLPVFHTS